MILFAIGMCEILEDYSELSLAGQDLLMFLTTITEKCTNFQLRLVCLKEKWVWSGKNLKLAWIGNPKKLIKNLVDGKFKCEVSNNVKIAAARWLNVSQKEKKIDKMLSLHCTQKGWRSSN